MNDLFPYLCPFADCNLKDKMWGVRSEWEAHLNNQHAIPNAQVGNTQQYIFTCKICSRTFFIDDLSRKEESSNPILVFRNSHYADHMERIASSIVKDYGPGDADHTKGTAPSAERRAFPPTSIKIPKKHSKRRRRRKYRAGSASGHDSSSSGRDEEAISGWSSEGSTGSRG